jgi:2-dehydro-3-deoxyphosphooctonate aldolase (KDO 8-P synthase)
MTHDRSVAIGDLTVGDGRLVLIAGPCVLEEPERMHRVAAGLVVAARDAGVGLIVKASFDKANRTSAAAYRGPGLEAGLRLLDELRRTHGVPVTTDVHEPWQAAAVAEVVDLLQVPAFLCRQTDLLVACAATGRPVNVKKGPFLAPNAVGPLVAKLREAGHGGVLLTERGTSFGHGDLVVDYRGLPAMRAHAPVVFDCTHATQRPASFGDRTGGDRALAAPLARAAVAMGVDAIFAEVHDEPDKARSDAATQLALHDVPRLLAQLVAVRRAVSATAG